MPDDQDDQDNQVTGATGSGGSTERDRHGRYARQMDTVMRDAQALRLRARGMTYQQIADEMGYAEKGAAYKAVQRGMEEIIGEAAAEVRALEVARLDAMYAQVMKVLETEHVTVSQGRVVRRRVLDENGDPIVVGQDRDDKPIYREEEILDDAPVLAAVDRLLRIQQRRAALLGLDAPTKQEIGGKLTYEVVGVGDDQL